MLSDQLEYSATHYLVRIYCILIRFAILQLIAFRLPNRRSDLGTNKWANRKRYPFISYRTNKNPTKKGGGGGVRYKHTQASGIFSLFLVMNYEAY